MATSTVTFGKRKFNGLPDAVRLISQGGQRKSQRERLVSLTITPTLGGRLMSLAVNERELAYFKAGLFSQTPRVLERMLAGRDMDNWDMAAVGGEKTWPAPQSLYGGKVPFPMLNLGPYDVQELDFTHSSLELLSRECPQSHLQIARAFIMEHGGPGTFRIISQLRNCSDRPIEAAPWSVFQLIKDPAARITVGPLSGPPILLPVDKIRQIPEGVVCETGDGFREFNLTPGGDSMFKVGLPIRGDQATMTTVFPAKDGAQAVELGMTFANSEGVRYPHATSTEIFDCPDYHEQEALMPMQPLAPGACSGRLIVDYRVNLVV